jgi:hypothetical protein
MPRGSKSGERRPRQVKQDNLRKEAEKLRSRLAEIEAEEKKFTERNQTIVGRAIMKLADADPKSLPETLLRSGACAVGACRS